MRLSQPRAPWVGIGALALAFVAPALASALVSQQAEASAQLTEQGRLALVNRQFDVALSDLNKAIEADASNPHAHYYRGLVLGNLGREREALDAFLKAAELNPGWGEAHRMAAVAALNTSNLPIAWEQAVKAHQTGADISESINQLLALEKAPGDLDDQLAAARVFVGGFDTSVFDRDGSRMGAKAILAQAAADLFSFQQAARETLSESAAFGLVQRQESAQYIMMFEIEFLTDTLNGSPRRLSGVLRLVDARSGETADRRRINFADISSLSYLNREWRRIIGLMEEWAAERGG
ncbi:MAG: tetratricopeptide repeat protein [Vicinamibacterales bacterium]|nr:tetratricopeptide repeat protein [Vicinamibacterales bacterium]